MQQLVFMSDLHLRRTTWSRHPDLWGDAYWALQQIIDYCVARNLPVIAAGDIFDKQLPDAESVKAMYEACDRMQAAGLPIYFIQGQHERSVHETWLGVHPWPTHCHLTLTELGDISFYGIDWVPADRIQAELAAVPENTDMLVSHQVWGEFTGFSPECHFPDVHHAELLLTGDYHVHKSVLSRTTQDEELLVLSPGAMHMQAIDEPEQKSFYHIWRDDADHRIKFASVPLSSRPVMRTRITNADELDQFVVAAEAFKTQAIENPAKSATDVEPPMHIRTPIFDVHYDEDIDLTGQLTPYSLIRQTTTGGFLFPSPYGKENEAQPVHHFSLDLGQDVLRQVLEEMEPEGPVRQSTAALLNSIDPSTTVSEMAEAAVADNQQGVTQ